MKESKAERFRRLANARVNKLFAMLRLLGNLSNPLCYEYRPEQVAQIFTALQAELSKARRRFFQKGSKSGKRFSLSAPAEEPIDEEHEPNFEIVLPDGSLLRAVGFEEDEYPGINVYRIASDGDKKLICFAEYNPGKAEDQRLHIGVYRSDGDDPVYYEPYEAERNEHEQAGPAPDSETGMAAGG